MNKRKDKKPSRISPRVQSGIFALMILLGIPLLCAVSYLSFMGYILFTNGISSQLTLPIGITSFAAVVVLLISTWRTRQHLKQRALIQKFQKAEQARVERLIEKDLVEAPYIEDNLSSQNEQSSL